ncbi:hypothetical protein [Noviherbaspirillum pedocola]|uniref:Uncharacterized protein n=1 Tax=Noviherbaspirillum pedocola TaxID=2801341 RepID=A0A934SY91_9BURK|nr:hypothetical protein [Noviherbaspirillum pedocola]MBK4737241.1 hypothetical protein [Noviherbaspirillum pedocola]
MDGRRHCGTAMRRKFPPARYHPHFAACAAFRESALKKQQGLTIIQLMVVLLVAGLVGFYVIRAVVDYRCKDDPTASVCQRSTGS